MTGISDSSEYAPRRVKCIQRWRRASACSSLCPPCGGLGTEPSTLLAIASVQASVARACGARNAAGRLRIEALGESLESDQPAVRRADGVTHPLPAVAVAVDVAVLELDACAVGAFGDETDLDLARPVRVRLDLPPQVDVPTEDDTVGRLVGEHPRPAAFAAVDATVVYVAAGARLEHHLGELCLEDVMLGRPPAADVLGKNRERALDRRLDDDRLADGCGCCLHGHETSSSRCSTAALKPVKARFHNWSR